MFRTAFRAASRLNTPATRRNAAATVGILGAWELSSKVFEAPQSLMCPRVAFADAAKVDYTKVRADIADILDQEGFDDGSLGPIFVRLGWHASGTFSKVDGSGGSDGATMRFDPEASHGANAGLHIARDVLETIKQKHEGLSYGDLWTLAAIVAIEEMGGPKVPWRPGRTDKPNGSHCTPDGRLPDADKGAQHLRDIFYRMGFDDQGIVALSGAHCLGRCHTQNSGFTGPWTNAPTTFSNLYFQDLTTRNWVPKKWSGPFQYANTDGGQEIMMLPTDMVLNEDPAFKKWTQLYAKDEAAFFADFSKAFCKLTENGVKFDQGFSYSPFVLISTLVGLATRYGQ